MSQTNDHRLSGCVDAAVWANEFSKVVPEVDHGLLLAWFANAIETARQHERDQPITVWVKNPIRL